MKFPVRWLHREGLSAQSCRTIRRGDQWREATLPDGASIEVNMDQQKPREERSSWCGSRRRSSSSASSETRTPAGLLTAPSEPSGVRGERPSVPPRIDPVRRSPKSTMKAVFIGVLGCRCTQIRAETSPLEQIRLAVRLAGQQTGDQQEEQVSANAARQAEAKTNRNETCYEGSSNSAACSARAERARRAISDQLCTRLLYDSASAARFLRSHSV